jgi:hypothetical protein
MLRDRGRPVSGNTALERSCEECGHPFTVRVPSDPKRLCSRSCATRAAQKARSASAALRRAEDAPYEPDEYDFAWAQELAARRATEPDRQIAAAKRLAAALIRSVGTSDRYGIATVLRKVARGDDAPGWEAFAIVLAECASPQRAAVVCAQPFGLFAAAARALPQVTEEASDAA